MIGIHPEHKVSGISSPIWIASSIVPLYDTLDGDMHIGEYALLPEGIYMAYLATSTNIGTTTTTVPPHKETFSDSNSLLLMSKINYIGKQYIDIFDNNGQQIIKKTTKNKYDSLNKPNPQSPSYSSI